MGSPLALFTFLRTHKPPPQSSLSICGFSLVASVSPTNCDYSFEAVNISSCGAAED